MSDTEIRSSTIEMGTPFQFVVDYWNLIAETKLMLNLYLLASDGTTVFKEILPNRGTELVWTSASQGFVSKLLRRAGPFT